MIIGNPYKFALTFDEVREWCCGSYLGAYQDYDKEQSRHIFEGIEISETVIDESQCDEITGRIEGCLKTM